MQFSYVTIAIVIFSQVTPFVMFCLSKAHLVFLGVYTRIIHILKTFNVQASQLCSQYNLFYLLNLGSKNNQLAVLEITFGHRTLSDQILKMSGQFHIMIGHDDRTSHQHILSYLLQGVVSQCFMSGPICQMSDQKEDLKGHMSCE